MALNQRSTRRSGRARIQPEQLESRHLLTGGAGNTFATIPAQISTAGGSTTVAFKISSDLFTTPHKSMVIGIDASALQDSSAQPRIQSVVDPHGRTLSVSHGHYGASVRKQLNGKTDTSAVLVTLDNLPQKPGQTADYKVNLSALNQTKGPLVVSFYLPGDVNGDGVVDRSDIKAIRAALGSKLGDSRYKLNDDANRDGVINASDLTIAQRNLGVRTVVNPNVTGAIDTSVFSNARIRSTSHSTLAFGGTATPGATIVVDDTTQKVPEVTATANANGQYQTNLTLGPGSNTFSVVVSDGFGQKNQGLVLPVLYLP